MTTTTSEHRFPASYGQQRLWFMCQLDPAADRAYHLVSAHEVEGPLDTVVLGRALGVLVARHEALRTRFLLLDETEAALGDRLVQVVGDPVPIPIVEHDLAGRPDEAVREVIEQESAREFDLDWGPLLRGCVIRRGPDRYTLVLVVHHIVGDAWSLGVLGRELSSAYAALAAGQDPELPELPVQYPDFAEWQRDLLEGPGYGGRIGYWRGALEGLPPLELPTDRPRPLRQSFRGGRVEVRLSAETVAAVAGLAQEADATPFMVHLAVWQATLGRLSGQRDFAVGTPVAGRARPEVEGVIGFFVNTLVLRADLSGTPSLRELVGRTHDTALAAFAEQDLPFEKLVEELAPERDLARAPLFQAGFAYQNVPPSALVLPGARVTAARVPVRHAATELGLTLHPDGGEVRGWIEYNSDLFDEASVLRLAGQWRTLLERALAAPDTPLNALPVLDADELRVLRELSGRDTPAPDGPSVLRAFEEYAAHTPAAPAVRAADGTLDYAGLAARTARLAHWLRARGVRPGHVVGVCLPRGTDLPAALLAVWRAGAAYLPLDPAYPAQRREFMAADAGAGLVLTPELLDDHSEEIAALPAEPPALDEIPEAPAYVIHTSGSTGTPKGVAVSHRSLAALVHAMAEEMELLPGDVWGAVTTVSFDIAALELFGPLSTGGTIALLHRTEVVDARLLAERLADTGADVVQATPTLWRALLDSGWRPAPHLRLASGGEALPEALAAELTEHGARVWNLYGPTETAVWSTAARVRPGEPVELGRPLPGEWLEVLDDAMRPVPPGAVGELYIGGVGIALGYLGRPGLTARRFLPDPWAPGRRMYRTGDLARRTPSGRLRYLGRADDQVKLRGHRIEPGEIEAVLTALPSVRAAAVALRGTEAPRLVGYIVPADPARPPAWRDLSEAVSARLPAPMVPAAWAVLPELPVTANGKTDRRALPDIRPAAAAGGTPPATELQRHILDVWRRLLERDDIGITDNFFAAGGHSMLAARLVGELRRTLDVRLSVGQIFVLGTVEAIAAALDAAPTPGGPPSVDTFEGEIAALWNDEHAGNTGHHRPGPQTGPDPHHDCEAADTSAVAAGRDEQEETS